MNNFEKLQSMSVEELAKWLDKHLAFDDAPHTLWFAKNYCDKCDLVEGQWEGTFGTHKCEFAYCEKNHKCRYFEELPEVPDDVEMVKLWLEAEVEE